MNEREGVRLMAVVAVDRKDRVVCQAPGCGRGVYARIHVVSDAGKLTVVGSDCFAKLYAGAAVSKAASWSASGGGRALTAEERLALIHNTDELLRKLETEFIEHQTRIQQQIPKQRAFSRPAARTWLPAPRQSVLPEIPSRFITMAKDLLRPKNPGLDLDAPGWSGLVRMEARRLMLEQGGGK